MTLHRLHGLTSSPITCLLNFFLLAGGREGKPLSSGVIVAISVTIFVALLLLVLCVLYFKRKTIGKRHVMYYKDMSSTPLEEDFDIQQDDFSEKAKIIYEESWRFLSRIKVRLLKTLRIYTNQLIAINLKSFYYEFFIL